MNKLFQNALAGVAQATPPIWFMRQAGRYHAHYQQLRAQHSFEDLCRRPELACQVALGPIEDFDFDVAILFSDLLFSIEALGLGLSYASGGPEITTPLTRDLLKTLSPVREALPRLAFQGEAMRLTREGLPGDKSLIGFIGGPATLFAYATGAGRNERLLEAKKALALYEPFCEKLLPVLEGNIALQLEGGAEAVMIFDTFAGSFPAFIFKDVIAKSLVPLVRNFPGRVGYYSKGLSDDCLRLPVFTAERWAGFGFDSRTDITRVLKERRSGFVQGNFDEILLHLPHDDFANLLESYLAGLRALSERDRAGWVCGLGHGVTPGTPEGNVRYFVKRIREVFV